jgi:Putative lumazine-binding
MNASLLLALLAVATTADAPPTDDRVRAPLRSYLMGHATGDASHMREAFLPTAHIEGTREGKFVSWNLEEYCARFTGKPANDEVSRRRTIDRVDVSGDVAMARATLVHGATTFTDYFLLIKVGDEWKIANKVYAARRTADR